MGIRLDCDRCGRVIKNIAIKNIRNLSENDGVCKICLDAEEKNKREIEQWKTRKISKLNDWATKAQEEYQVMLKQQVDKRLAEDK